MSPTVIRDMPDHHLLTLKAVLRELKILNLLAGKVADDYAEAVKIVDEPEPPANEETDTAAAETSDAETSADSKKDATAGNEQSNGDQSPHLKASSS